MNFTNGYFDRRSFLKVGSLSLFGSLSLGDVLSLRAASPPSQAPKKDLSVILFWLQGGISQLESWDMKPDADPKYRGIYKPHPHERTGVPYLREVARNGQTRRQVCLYPIDDTSVCRSRRCLCDDADGPQAAIHHPVPAHGFGGLERTRAEDGCAAVCAGPRTGDGAREPGLSGTAVSGV